MNLVTALPLIAQLIGMALAAIGPVTDLHVVNNFIQPDGFNRSYILAEGVFPGPLISGKKVCLGSARSYLYAKAYVFTSRAITSKSM